MKLATGRRAIPAVALTALIILASGCSALRRAGYEGIGRDSWQQPERVIAELGIAAGQSVADLGAGGGYFTWRLADAVGTGGQVYAVDIDPDMIEYIDSEARDRGVANVSTVLATFEDPRVPESVDLIFSSNTYHHIEDRVVYFRHARQYLKPGGRIAIIDLVMSGNFVKRWFLAGHSTPPDQIQREFEEAGYALDAQHDFLETQSFLVFTPRTN